jgi:hypothetical protein
MKFPNVHEDTIVAACLLLGAKFQELDDNIPLIGEIIKAHSVVATPLLDQE